jgi:hypothetical protein
VVTRRSPAVDRVAEDLAARVLAAPPTMAGGRLVAVDGPAGAGKTTLAAALRRHLRDALRPAGGRVVLIHMDNVYDGWEGLEAGMRTVDADVVGPLLDGRPGHYRRYDWLAGRFAEQHTVEPCEVLLVEASGRPATTAPRSRRRRRCWCGWRHRTSYAWTGRSPVTARRRETP